MSILLRRATGIFCAFLCGWGGATYLAAQVSDDDSSRRVRWRRPSERPAAPPSAPGAGVEEEELRKAEQAIAEALKGGMTEGTDEFAGMGEEAGENGEEEGTAEEETELVSLDFDNVDIKLVIKLISDLTGTNFILSDQVRGTVTVMSPTKISIDELFKVLESILEVRKLTMVPATDDLIKIVPKREAVKSAIEFEDEEGVKERAPEDALVTQLINVQYADFNEIRTVITTLAGPDASVVPYPPTSTLIISDTISNLDRLMKIIEEIDIPGLESTITVVPLRYAAATVMAEQVLAIVQQKGGTTAAAFSRTTRRRRSRRRVPARAASGEDAIKIFADERTNALVIVASPEDTERVLALVEELDRQTPEATTRVRVKRLSYSNSDDVASVLSSLVSGRSGEGLSSISVTSYPEINALIVDASPQDFELLERIVEDLDIPRDQVMVEVIISEVDLGRSISSEFQAQTLGLIDWTPDSERNEMGWSDTQNWGGIEFSPSFRQKIIDDLQKGYPISGGEGINIGFLRGEEDSDNEIGDFGVLLNALQADTDINILAAPQVLTCDNEEVSFMVVENIPVVTSTLTSGSGTAATDTIQQIDYRDVGTQIKLIPHISKDRFVRLEIEQKTDHLVGVSLADITGPLTPATLKRETSTVINVKDGHTVVLSGMISDSYTTQESKVPILGDIPILGLLARFRKLSVSKINLMIFIRPHIVRNPSELAEVTRTTRGRGDEFLKEAHGRAPRFIDRFIPPPRDEMIDGLPPAGEAQEPYGFE